MRSITFFYVTILLLAFSIPIPVLAAVSSNTYNIELHKQNSSNEYPEKDNDREGHRMPSRPIYCIISIENGITIYDASEEITSYEIWNKEGDVCLNVLSEESDFINELFSKTGVYLIRLFSDKYTYYGLISCGI